ncbi:putative heavy metal-associated domain, HMA [Medicago truncatula]|uniref:Putative heavy metal-associated domain, HMA n=1 Tax=Medicago truncatula TaxID=3880 RepID=A0A396IJZ0_MEDTR|nr:copper transport protein CCH [Medicago truncatula]RHN63247.1 putative heavy metal-associated domain, HMA [Medicago truncatula]
MASRNENDNRSLLYLENLTLPSFQVVVIEATTGCNGCQERVSRIVSKMIGLTEYTIDVRKNEVSVKGDFMARCDFQSKSFRSRALKSSTDQPKSLFACLTQFDKHKCNKK